MKRPTKLLAVLTLLLLGLTVLTPAGEAKVVTIQEDGVTILPGSMQKIKLNQFTKGASARIQVAVNKRVSNRTVNVYLAAEYKLVGISVDELPYKNFAQSRENITKVDFTYTNNDGETYYLVIANPERFQGERDIPGTEAVISYKIEITIPEEKKSSLPLILSIIIILMAVFFIIIMYLRKRRAQAYQQAYYQSQFPGQVSAVPPLAYPPTYPTATPIPPQPQPAPAPPGPQIGQPSYDFPGTAQQYPPVEEYTPEEYPAETYPPETPEEEVSPQAQGFPQQPYVDQPPQTESTLPDSGAEIPSPSGDSSSEDHPPENPSEEDHTVAGGLHPEITPEEETSETQPIEDGGSSTEENAETPQQV